MLRSLLREGAGRERFPDLDTDPEEHLSTWGSHPRWLIRRWLLRWPVDDVVQLVRRNNHPAPLFFRPLGLGLEEARKALSRQGWDAREVGSGVPCLRLENGIDPAKILETVPGVVQDPGAALVTVYADLPRRGLVADLCAAPGGKALALAEGGSYVLAADRSLRRLELVRENASRVGARIHVVAALAQSPPFRELSGILLDVPCSGTGTLRRHPDLRWRLTEETLRTLVEVQRDILDAGAEILARGGVLVYSTCSLEMEENQKQVESFLARWPGFALEPSGEVYDRFMEGQGYLSVTPQAAGFDGAFAARLVRQT